MAGMSDSMAGACAKQLCDMADGLGQGGTVSLSTDLTSFVREHFKCELDDTGGGGSRIACEDLQKCAEACRDGLRRRKSAKRPAAPPQE